MQWAALDFQHYASEMFAISAYVFVSWHILRRLRELRHSFIPTCLDYEENHKTPYEHSYRYTCMLHLRNYVPQLNYSHPKYTSLFKPLESCLWEHKMFDIKHISGGISITPPRGSELSALYTLCPLTPTPISFCVKIPYMSQGSANPGSGPYDGRVTLAKPVTKPIIHWKK